MWELDCEEGWVPKNWCFWTVVLEKTLESPLDCKEIQPVHPKGDQSWVFIGVTDAKAETPILWPPHAKSCLIGKDSDAGRDWGQEEKGMTGDEMTGWHHWLGGHEFEWTLGDGDGQGGLSCSSPWDHKELDTTERLNDWTEVWTESGLVPVATSPYPWILSKSHLTNINPVVANRDLLWTIRHPFHLYGSERTSETDDRRPNNTTIFPLLFSLREIQEF